jgi:predicted DNA binding protein
MANESGGVNDVFDTGHITARQLAALMSAYTAGLYDATKITA